jgi:uncharacterized membrane protein YccF (DUF307 family)
MKKETLRAVLLLFLCSGFWVMTLALAASFLGIGFAQGPQVPYQSQATVPPFGIQPPVNALPFGPPYINNNAMLSNQTQATFNMGTQEVNIPFQIDTSRWLAFSVVVDNSVQTVTVLDPINQSLVVYHIYLDGPDMGKCELTSARYISADLKYDSYEAMKPFPPQVRATIEEADIERKRQ